MIRTEATVSIARSPADVFDFLDDLTKTPAWNSRCVEARQVSPGPRRAGSKLHYTYREGARQGAMDGEVLTHEPGTALTLRFIDAMLIVDVAFALAAEGTGTRLTHRSEIEPKRFLMRLLTPFIRKATQRQTKDLVAKVKAALEVP